MTEHETSSERTKRETLERRTMKIAHGIKRSLPPSEGFLLICFDFGQNGHMAYASNGRREDVLKLLREFLGRIA